MFFASDDECEKLHSEKPSSLVPSADGINLQFLSSPCLCGRRVCYQQFQSQIGPLISKRREFRSLKPEEKARCGQCFCFG